MIRSFALALVAGLLLAMAAGSATARVIYVKSLSFGAKTGESWTDAYDDVQPALAAAVEGDEIWVAMGIYPPTTAGDRSASFVLKAGVGLYGGFAGNETSRKQRNREANETILSGEIGQPGNSDDNSHCVIVGRSGAVLDGFVIAGGHAPFFGAGMRNENESPNIQDCIFRFNLTSGGGAAVYNRNSLATFTNCTFSDNIAYRGAAIYNEGGAPLLTQCTFVDNWATEGGAVTNILGTRARFGNCTFISNTAYLNGGAMLNEDCEPEIVGCDFLANTAPRGGGIFNDRSSAAVKRCEFSDTPIGSGSTDGAGIYSRESSLTITGSSFSRLLADNGAGVHNQFSDTTLVDCEFVQNLSRRQGGGVYTKGGEIRVNNCKFEKNDLGTGSGMLNCGARATIENCSFIDNLPTYTEAGVLANIESSNVLVAKCDFLLNTTVGIRNMGSTLLLDRCKFQENHAGGLRNLDGSVTVTRCTLIGNTGGAITTENGFFEMTDSMIIGNSGSDGAGLIAMGNIEISGCTFAWNAASGGGGALSLVNVTTGTIMNCLIEENHGGSGGGILLAGGRPRFVNCAITNNSATVGGGVASSESHPSFESCVFAGNEAGGSSPGGRGGAIHNTGGAPIFNNCTVVGNTAQAEGGGVYQSGTGGLMNKVNCIFWGNSAPVGMNVRRASGLNAFIHSTVQSSGGSGAGWDVSVGIDGGGNRDADPLFADAVNPAGPDGTWLSGDDGLRLREGSACIDAGRAQGAPVTDILGLPRLGGVDMGAYEYVARNSGVRDWAAYH